MKETKKEPIINSDFSGLYKCNCGRPWCEYFAPVVGENGDSFTREQLENKLVQLKADIEIIEKVLNEG